MAESGSSDTLNASRESRERVGHSPMEHPRSRIIRDESDDYFVFGHPSVHGVSHHGFVVIAVLATSALDDREVVLSKI